MTKLAAEHEASSELEAATERPQLPALPATTSNAADSIQASRSQVAGQLDSAIRVASQISGEPLPPTCTGTDQQQDGAAGTAATQGPTTWLQWEQQLQVKKIFVLQALNTRC